MRRRACTVAVFLSRRVLAFDFLAFGGGSPCVGWVRGSANNCDNGNDIDDAIDGGNLGGQDTSTARGPDVSADLSSINNVVGGVVSTVGPTEGVDVPCRGQSGPHTGRQTRCGQTAFSSARGICGPPSASAAKDLQAFELLAPSDFKALRGSVKVTCDGRPHRYPRLREKPKGCTTNRSQRSPPIRPSTAQEGLASNGSHSMARVTNSADGAASVPSMARKVADLQPDNIHNIQVAVGAGSAAGIVEDGPSPQHLGDTQSQDRGYLNVLPESSD